MIVRRFVDIYDSMFASSKSAKIKYKRPLDKFGYLAKRFISEFL
jgi:hypothetical protein